MGYLGTKYIYKYSVTKHGVGEYVKDKVIHSNTIESFWSIFKRGYVGVYHYMSKKHLQRYIDEYVFRYNNKAECTSLMIVLSEGKKLHYRDLIHG